MAQWINWGPGATTCGVVCKNGIVLASEKKVHFGGRILSKSGKKVFKITDWIGAACAGLVSDFQVLTSTIRAYTSLFTFERTRRISVKSTAKFMSGILYSRRWFPYFTDTLIGGIDENGGQLYALDLIGSLIDDVYAAIGTGAQIAVGVLEENYKEGISLEEGKQLLVKAIKTASERDPLSGNGIDLLLIKSDGVEELEIPL
ncbi:MAG: proteasome subunit beta [Candidatus Helarchaeota archaeon]